jgi:hypothetical protein
MHVSRVLHIEHFDRIKLSCYCSIGKDHTYGEWRELLMEAERQEDRRARYGLISTGR